MATIVCEDSRTDLPVAAGDADDLWIGADRVPAATGWILKPEGLCRGDVCVPVPRHRESTFVRDGEVNIAAFWRLMGRPAVHAEDGDVWVLGASADDRAQALQSLEAPDFALADLDGRVHRLSEHRGKKVLLVTWASW